MPEQIAAFNRYVTWMLNYFHDRIHYWALWNEQDIGYWNSWGNAEQYGTLLSSDTVHKTGTGRANPCCERGRASRSIPSLIVLNLAMP
jgi:hypothetical protein